jgi:hypothetical protein
MIFLFRRKIDWHVTEQIPVHISQNSPKYWQSKLAFAQRLSDPVKSMCSAGHRRGL